MRGGTALLSGHSSSNEDCQEAEVTNGDQSKRYVMHGSARLRTTSACGSVDDTVSLPCTLLAAKRLAWLAPRWTTLRNWIIREAREKELGPI